MAERMNFGNETKELIIGRSFDSKPGVNFHTMRYDFKPASVDVKQHAQVECGSGHSVKVTVPHVEGCDTAQTVYKGNKRPVQKECVLIIDNKTGEITLEKVSYNMQLKKTRSEGSSKATIANRPVTPSEQIKQIKSRKKASSDKHKSSDASSHSKESQMDVVTSMDTGAPSKPEPPKVTSLSSYNDSQRSKIAILKDDLQLSDSGSDSD